LGEVTEGRTLEVVGRKVGLSDETLRLDKWAKSNSGERKEG
jgi:hypothetical protein